MSSSMFWRKLILLNIGLFIVIIRLYGIIFDKLEKKTANPSVFPSFDEDGYPFLEHLNCNLKNLYLNSKALGNNIIIPKIINLKEDNKSNICSLYDKQLICKNDSLCLERLNNNNNSHLNFELPLYHIIDEFDGKIFWNSINEQNYILNKKSLNIVHKILSGYEAYVNLILYNKIKDENFIKDKVTSNYDILNNLFYLHSLILQSSFLIDDEDGFLDFRNKSQINIYFLKDYYNQCIKVSSGNLNEYNSLVQDDILIIFNNIKKIINCIPENNLISKKSSLIDIEAIITILKIHFKRQITENEFEKFKFFSSNLIYTINEIFNLDIHIKREAIKYNNISKNLFIFFWGAIITGILFVNKYFIQYKEYYSRKDNKYTYRQKMEYKMKQMKEYQEHLKKIKEKTSKENNEKYGESLKNYSPEELKYIEKITSNSNGKGEEFVFTQNK